MGYLDDFYDEMYAREEAMKEATNNSIIREFENLSLEEKVNRLIKIYARKEAYN